MAEVSNIRIDGLNTAETVAVVHEALLGVAEALGLEALETDDLNTAVIEACNNVVHHAYEWGEGPIEVEIYALAGAVEVAVRDSGIGIRPHLGERTQPHTGIGMPIVHALTERVAFSKLAGGGTEVSMLFATPGAAALEQLDEHRPQSHIAGAGERAGTIEISLGPSSVARAVLPRLLSSLAARAGFAAGRISGVRLLAGTIATSAHDAISDGHLGVAVSLAPLKLELRIGPLRAGSATTLLESSTDDLGLEVERVTDDRHVAPS
jgi:anti-sigma regulatory factor (Ser/Thr protein kinase)